VIIVVAVALFIPPRAVHATQVGKLDAAETRELAFAEARAVLQPGDGDAVYRATKLWSNARQWDWAIESAASAIQPSASSPTHWRVLMAVSVAHIDRFEAQAALDFATQAVAACAKAPPGGCPSWEEVRLELYQRHLEAGVRSGIDPRKDPHGFRRAGEAGLRRAVMIDSSGAGVAPPPPAPK
jgi:hypothetical protein